MTIEEKIDMKNIKITIWMICGIAIFCLSFISRVGAGLILLAWLISASFID